MDENESIMSVQKPEQTECRFLLKAKKGEATPQREHLETPPPGEEDITNGLTPHIHDGQSTSVCSPGTSYWCVSETTDSPLLLSPVPGPSVQEPPPIKPTPGKDHRRYYHEYWRSEYLMDFDWQRHGMICMVCGSSLATLKLSTIKRHIKQKHPYSLLWSESDKEVIRLGWESHLNLENRQRPICSDPDNAPESKEMLEVDRQSGGKPESAVTQAPSLSQSEDPPSPPASLVQDLPSPTPQVLERYLNDSLHAWFRQEFLMEYQAEMGRLVCMVCSCLLPSLHLDHIKSHVLDLHPNSLLYSAEEKHSILQTWAKTHGEESDFLQDVKLEQHTKEVSIDGSVQSFPLDLNPTQGSMESYLRKDENISEADKKAQSVPCFPRKRKLKYGSPWRLRLDYLVAYGPPDNPRCYCMVCSEHLPVPRVSNFRKHIQACHPETSGLSRNERDALIRAWTKNNTNSSLPKEDDVHGGTADVNKVINAQASPVKIPEQECIKTEENKSTNITPPTQTVGRNRHYPGKDQRRNYQAHWRMDFLMDYDCKRHGLICMVCGATLATLKVSTIKRHVLQLHPHSMQYSPEEKQLVLLSYSQISLHLHSADCFSGSNHSHKENANGNTGLTLNQST